MKNENAGTLSDQHISMFFNTVLFDKVEVHYHDSKMAINCSTDFECSVVLPHVPSLIPQSLRIKLTQAEGKFAKKEEDLLLTYKVTHAKTGLTSTKSLNLLLIDQIQPEPSQPAVVVPE